MDFIPGARGAGRLFFGAREMSLAAGTSVAGDVFTAAAQIKIQGGNNFGSSDSSFTGTIYTLPLPD